jgi:hypothetical protein
MHLITGLVLCAGAQQRFLFSMYGLQDYCVGRNNGAESGGGVPFTIAHPHSIPVIKSPDPRRSHIAIPLLRRGLGAFARTSLADGTDLDGPKAATNKQQKQGHVTFQTASSVRGLEGEP